MNTTTTTMTNEGKKFGSHVQRAPEVRSIERLQAWGLNPREDDEARVDELGLSLQEEGQLDDVHVMETVGAEVILRGHRRVKAMRKIGWTECRQVAHKFSDLRDAFRFAITDFGQTVPLTGHEKLIMVTNAEGLGLDGEDLARTLGVARETVTKYHELALGLPQNARMALASDKLSMNTAELLLEVPTESRRDAAQMILKDLETGEPMAHGQARAYIQAHYVLPARWEKEWLVLELKLKKKFKVAEGYHYVPWAERLSYVMGDSGQPEPGWEFATSFMPREKHGRTWGEVAFAHEVPIYVVPAPWHREGYVVLVQGKMLRDAMSVGAREEAREEGEGVEGEECSVPSAECSVADEDEGAVDDGGAAEEVVGVGDGVGDWLRVWLGAIYEALMRNPTEVMTKEPWLPLRKYLAWLTTDVDEGALEAWQGIASEEGALAWMEGDTRQRSSLRTTLMLLLCAAHDASGADGVIREVGAALGLDAGALDAKAEAGGKC